MVDAVATTGPDTFVTQDQRSVAFWDLRRIARLGTPVLDDLPLLRDHPVVAGLASDRSGALPLLDLAAITTPNA